MYKSVFVFICIVGIVIGGYANNFVDKRYRGSYGNDQLFPEVPCTASGGICVRSSDCPAGKLAPTPGLCPVQQRKGVECCYGVGRSETRCRENGGECVLKTSQCPENLIFGRATDCNSNQKCCVQV